MRKKAIGYCRVSTDKQGQLGESLEDQTRVCLEIAGRLNADLVPDGKLFKDTFSGRKNSRPAFDAAMDYIRHHQGEVDYFIVRNIDRLTRGGSTSYSHLKDELVKYGVEIIDGYGIVQPSLNTLAAQGFEYDWSKHSPSETSELITAQASKTEVTTILTRLIGQEINLANQGFRVRAENDGYINKKIITDGGKKKTIQIPDPARADFFREMFRLRAENSYNDQEICQKINAMGFRTKEKNRWDSERKLIIGKRGGVKLTVKILQSFLKRPAYCAVHCEKWTRFLPIRAPYAGLVNINTFNRANRGKVFIKEYPDGSLEIAYNQKAKPLVKSRTKNNALYPFRNIVLCPSCNGSFKGSASRGKSGKRYENYHCSRGHKYFGIPKDVFEGKIKSFVQSLELNQEFLEILDSKLVKEYRKHQSELLQASASIHRHIADLESLKQQIVDSIVGSTSSVVKRELERRVEATEQEIEDARTQSKKAEVDENDVSVFLKYAKYFMEHIDEMLIDTDDMQRQQALFGLVFEEFPTYSEIVSGTPKLSLVFATKKTSLDEKSSLVTSPGVEPGLQA